jgi:hypothetical protein
MAVSLKENNLIRFFIKNLKVVSVETSGEELSGSFLEHDDSVLIIHPLVFVDHANATLVKNGNGGQ